MPPKRNNSCPCVTLVNRVLDISTIRTEGGRHHQTHGPCTELYLTLVHIVLPPELIQRQILHVRQLHSHVAAIELVLHQPFPLVEFRHAAIIVHWLILVRAPFHFIPRLDRRHPTRVQTHDGHHRNDHRQLQAQLHSLVRVIIALTERSREELLDRTPQEIRPLVFGNILAHFIHGILQHFIQPS